MHSVGLSGDCPSINRFEVLLKEDEEGEPDHMRGF
jgi:hypothetical protein